MQTLALLGGTGFVGRALLYRLTALNRRLRVFTRSYARHRDLLVLPDLELIEGNAHNREFLARGLAGADAVINLVGILNERGHRGKGFERAHVTLPETLVDACRQAGVRRVLHMSALGAAPDGPSFYLRTKGLGEEAVHGAGLDVTSFRPSVIFGTHDSFTNRFARLLRLTPGVFPLACAQAKFQPVYVEDVVQAFLWALDHRAAVGQRYDLCGPRVHTLEEIVRYVAALIGVRRRIVALGPRLSHLQAALFEFAPGKPFSLDNYRSLTQDSVCTAAPALPWAPRALEEIAPIYLGRRKHA